jgi:hypothetical protein
MPALLVNIRINDSRKLELFYKTSLDVFKIFTEIHIKFRGKFSEDCLKHVRSMQDDLKSTPIYYQELSEKDWVDTTLTILENIKSRSVFMYFEDHILLSSSLMLDNILKEFDLKRLDYLTYSFFNASSLEINNILPLNPVHNDLFSTFILNDESAVLLNNISPNYYSFSLVSVNSTKYLKNILEKENIKSKVHNKYLSYIISLLFKYPTYRKFISILNKILSFASVRIFYYPYDSPFNLEKILFEHGTYNNLKVGLLKNELFANFDDDNGCYKESLIKRGLYPFSCTINESDNKYLMSRRLLSCHVKEFNSGDRYKCTYYPRMGRINSIPIVKIGVLHGEIGVQCMDGLFTLVAESSKEFYSNKKLYIVANKEAKVEISLYV